MRRSITALACCAIVLSACGTDVATNSETAATSSATTTTATTTTGTQAPTTVPATTTGVTETPPTTTTMDAFSEDELAIIDAYGVAFDSESTFEETAPFLVAPEGLEETVAGYQSIGTQMGGVSVEVEQIEIDGTGATVIYTLLFGGNPSYSGLTGSAVLTDAGWQISRDMFCGLMTNARVGCPDA